MAAAPASAAHAPHVPMIAALHPRHVGVMTRVRVGAMMSLSHRAGTMMIGRLVVRPVIARNDPVQHEAMNARVAMIAEVTNGHRGVGAPATGQHSGTTVVVMIVLQAAGLPAAMTIGPPTVIPRQDGAGRVERAMNGRTTQANQGALRREVTIASARRSDQGQARAPGPVRRVAAKAINVHSAFAPGPPVTTPATGRARAAADRPRANRNSFPDRSG